MFIKYNPKNCDVGNARLLNLRLFESIGIVSDGERASVGVYSGRSYMPLIGNLTPDRADEVFEHIEDMIFRNAPLVDITFYYRYVGEENEEWED